MIPLSIQLPPIQTDKYVEVDVKVNGQRKQFKYRVEVFQWNDWLRPDEPRAIAIRRMVEAYDRNWQLMEIGSPTEVSVPLMFRHTG